MENIEFKEMIVSAVNKLRVQNRKSADRYGACRYLNANGDSCIVGHMMPDDQTRNMADRGYDDHGQCVQTLWYNGLPWMQQFSKEQILLMTKLQTSHDESKVNNVNLFVDAIYDMESLVEDYFYENIFNT